METAQMCMSITDLAGKETPILSELAIIAIWHTGTWDWTRGRNSGKTVPYQLS